MAHQADDWMPVLKVTRVYPGEPRRSSEVAHIRSVSSHTDGLFLEEIPGADNEIILKVVSVNGVARPEHTGGGHHFEVAPGPCRLVIEWLRAERESNLAAWWYVSRRDGTMFIDVQAEAGKRYILKIVPTRYGAPDVLVEQR